MPHPTSRKSVGRYERKYDRYDEQNRMRSRSRDYKMGGNALYRKVGGTKKHRRGGSKRSRTHRMRM